jgi:hypothetical protein
MKQLNCFVMILARKDPKAAKPQRQQAQRRAAGAPRKVRVARRPALALGGCGRVRALGAGIYLGRSSKLTKGKISPRK